MAFNTSREIAATPAQVFAAFIDADRMAKWWGPKGFTNTFHSRDFKTGGKWSYTMYGPQGVGQYANESVFELVSPAKVIIRHISKPIYLLTITIAVSGKGTLVTWSQEFEDAGVAERIKHIVVPANEENLDRLTAEVLQ